MIQTNAIEPDKLDIFCPQSGKILGYVKECTAFFAELNKTVIFASQAAALKAFKTLKSKKKTKTSTNNLTLF